MSSQQIVDDGRANGSGVRRVDVQRAGGGPVGAYRRAMARWLVALAVALVSMNAAAQIQRGFVNLGFEQPSAGATSCVFIIGEGAIPGWTTTHPAATGAQPNSYCPPNITAATPGATTGGQIEVWANSVFSVASLSGTQHAELNAYQASRLFQQVCLINGETVSFSLGHRGRGSATVADVTEFNIDSAANTVVRASTTNNGTGGVVQCGGSVVAATNGPVAGTTDGSVTTPTCSSATATGGWRRYTGSFTWSGTSGTHDFGFESISSASGASVGNFLDEVAITLRPVIEISSATFSSREGAASPTQPSLTVVGTVPAGGIPITITATGGTATNGTDYTLGTFTVPAGDYELPTVVPMTGLITVINDTVIEDNETIQLQIQPNANYLLNSTSVCNGAAQATTTFTILDNDVDVRTTKSVTGANPPPGGTTTFTVTYQNNTARPTVGDLTAHDASSNLADALPAGFSAYAWTCAASGTPAPACPAASGTGSIAATATLPAGNAGAAGGTLTYTITGTVDVGQCGAVTNTSTVALADVAVQQGTSVQAGYTTPAPGGTANDTASAGIDPGCLTLNKTTLNGVGGPFTFALTNTLQTSGTATTATAGTPVQVDGNAAAGTQPFGISTVGTALTIDESALPANFALSAATCSNGSTNVGSLAGSTYTIGAADITAGTDYTCTFTNQRVRTVTVNKTLNPAADAGRFNLQINGSTVATNVGNGGTGNNAAVAVGSTVTVAELAGTPNAGLSAYATTLACTGATVTPGSGNQSGTFTMPDADVSCTFTNSAIVNLAVTKTATPSGTYLPGQPLDYTITVPNNGPAAVSGVSVTDTVPSSVTVSAWTCTAVGAGADCDTTAAGTGAAGSGNNIALTSVALGAGESLAIAVSGTAQLSATGPIVNSVTVAPPAGTTCTTPPCTVTATVTNGDSGQPQLTLAKTATPSSFAVGQTGTYTLQLSNSGTSSTVGTITISDPLPSGITTTATPSGTGWNCAASTATTVTCTTTTVFLPGSNAPPISVPVAIAVGTTSPAVNTASASGGGDASCPAATHCQGTTSTPINAPLLDLSKVLQGNLVVGVSSNYVLTVTNNGQAATLAGTVTDTIPTGLTIGTLPAGCSAAGQTVTCALPAGIAPGNMVSYTIPVTPQASTNGQSLTNSATVSGGGDPSCPAAPHCGDTTTDTVGAPQLTIVKSATPSNFVIGVPATYTLQVTNTGTAATTAATTITDTIPTGLAIGAMPAGCTVSGQVVTCTIATGLATGAPVAFNIPVTAQPSLVGAGSVTNTATATGGGDPGCPSTSVTLPARCIGTTTTAIDAPRLDIVKSASGTNFVVGVPASYTLQVTNNGTAATTQAATVTDTIPNDLTIGTLPAGCSAAGQVVTCTIPAGLATGSSTSFVIPVTPTAAANGNTQINSATVTGGGDPTCPGAAHCGSTTNTPVNAPQLTMTKTASGSNFVVGVPASYTLTVTNTGTAATTQPATVSDTFPSSLTIGTLPAGCTASGQVVTCTIAAGLATGTPVSFVIPVTPQPAADGTTVTNNARVSGGGDPTCPGAPHCGSTTNTPVNAPQLTIVKSASGSNFVVGVPASYTLTVTNTGTAATTQTATVSDTIPGTLTIGTLPAGCTATGQMVTCTIAAGLATGTPVSFVIPVTPTPAAIGTSVSNSATVTGGGDPTCPGGSHCSSTTTTPVEAPQLTIAKTASGSSFVVGMPASYTLTVTNTGTVATTQTATISDTIPSTLTIGTPLPAGCTASGQVVTCTIAAGLATGTPVSFVIPVTPTPAANGTTVTNSATVSGGGDPTCPAANRCTGTIGVPVNAPQLTIEKNASGSSFVVGQPASYTLTVTNTGTAATTAAASISDTVPSTLTIGTLPAGCTASGQVVTCTIAAGLATGTPVSFVIPVTPQPAADGTTVANSATVSGGGDPTCPGAAHCDSTTTTPVNAPQLTIEKTASGSSFVVGVPASYTLTVTNTGTAATTAVATISDTIPSTLTIGTPLPAACTASGQVVACTIAAGLATGTPVSFVIPVTPTPAADGTTVTNNATVSGGGDPTCPGGAHCDSTTTTPVNAPQLSIEKTASGSSFVVGVPASYTLTVTNTGTAATTAVATISDTIPSTLMIGTPLPVDCTASGQLVTCTIAAGVATGTPVSFVIPITPTPAADGTTVTNNATVSGGGDPTCPGSAHCDSTTTTPVNAPQLSIEKTASGSSFVVGVPASYTLTVTNTGTAATTAAATISDTIPSTLTIGTLPAGCTASGQVVTCTIAAGLATGTPVSFVIPVTPQPAADGTTVTNNATVSGGGDPTCPGAAHCDSTTTTPVNAPQLTLVKTASGSNFVVGVPASYTLTVTNTGTAATTAAASVSDTIPSTLTIGTPLPAGCTASGQVVTCTIAAGLATGAPVSFVIPVTPQPAASGTTVTNNATVSGGGDPTCPGATHCSSTTTTPVNAPQLSIEKTASGSNFVVGVPASYTLTVTNTGTAATTQTATVSDTIPSTLSIGAPLTAGCSASGQVVSCTIAAGLAVGANVAFVIPVTATAAASGTTVTNSATVSGGGDATCPAATRCTGTVDVPVDAPRLDIDKTASSANFVVGQPASYTLTVTNTGTAATTAAVSISDTVPAGLTLGTLPAGCTASGQVVTCTIAAGLAIGANVAFVIPVTPTAAVSGTTVANTATVSGGGDPTCPGNAATCSSTVNVPVNAPQLTIVKTASSANFVVGVAASYTLTVTNTGSAATTAAASVSDTIPASLTLGAMPAGCTASGQTVTCTIAAGLAAGANVAFVIPVTATAAASGTTVVNTATVSGGGDPTCPGAANCTSTVQTPVDRPALAIVKTASAANFVVGVPASYTLTVTNTGSAATTAIATVTDTVPASLMLGTMPTDCSASGQTVTCTIAAGLAAGANVAFVIPVTPTAAAAGTTIVNTATVAGGGSACPNAASCTGTVDVPVDSPALTLVKTASAATFSVNVPASYTLTVTNTGNAATTAVSTVSDMVPTGLTIGAMPAGCTATGQAVSCTIAAGLAPGASVAFVIPVTPTAAVGGTTVTNAAVVSGGGTTCPQAATCNSSVSVPIVALLRLPIPALSAPMLAGMIVLLGLLALTARPMRRVVAGGNDRTRGR
jgi:uncharacterized repeat protein (TIGR01451 family)